MTDQLRIMVFGSHSPKPGEPDYEEARELGRELAAAGFDVASGGYGGTMEAVLLGAAKENRPGYGYTAGIFRASPNQAVAHNIESDSLLERIEKMIADCAGFVVLKGGTGTLLELAACWEMVNKKMVAARPIVCLGGFWRPAVEILSGEPSIEGLENLKPTAASAAEVISFADTPAEAAAIMVRELR